MRSSKAAIGEGVEGNKSGTARMLDGAGWFRAEEAMQWALVRDCYQRSSGVWCFGVVLRWGSLNK